MSLDLLTFITYLLYWYWGKILRQNR